MEKLRHRVNTGLLSPAEIATVPMPPALTQPSTQMKRTLNTLVGCGAWLLVTALTPTMASASDHVVKASEKTRAVNHRNEQYDVNKDGKLDEQEVQAMKADRAAKRQAHLLAKYDVNKNGQLDPDEEAKHKADLEQRRLQRAERKKAKAAEQAAAQATDEEDDDEETPTKH